MNTGEILEIHEWKTLLSTWKWHNGENASGNVVIAQAGLGDDAQSLKLITSIKRKVTREWNYSLLVVDHPHHGNNCRGPGNADFTLDLCRRASKIALDILLKTDGVKKIIPVGYSMGFWSLVQAIVLMESLDPKIRIILWKSGVFSYHHILSRYLEERGYSEDVQKAWEKLFRDFELDATSWLWNMPILPWQPPVKIHSNFLTTIPELQERSIIWLPLKLWHGEMDHWTLASEISALWGAGNIQTTIIPNLGHSLRPNNSVDSEILDAIDAGFSPYWPN